MNGLFALGFGAPLALVGLLALPLIWWLVRRTPLATARTWPFSAVSRITIRSASPRSYVRSTTASSR